MKEDVTSNGGMRSPLRKLATIVGSGSSPDRQDKTDALDSLSPTSG